MCVIVDANLASAVFASPTDPAFLPLIVWLHGKGRLAYGARLTRELERVQAARRYPLELNRAGRAVASPEATIEAEQRGIKCRSDDSHVIALARVSGARTLCSRDKTLHRDFKDPRLVAHPRGVVYQSAEHARLLRHTRSCGFGRQ